MNNYFLLIGISCVPAVTGMCITLPLWLPEAPAQPNDPYARADRSFPDPGKLPAAGNHG